MLELQVGDVMGRVTTEVTFENLEDALQARRGELDPKLVRRLVVTDALVDTGCTTVGLRKADIATLGLTALRPQRVIGAIGVATTTIYGAVQLTIDGRECFTDVFEVPDHVPVLIGQIPLERLDFVVNPVSQTLEGNPRHGGEHALEAYGVYDFTDHDLPGSATSES